MSNLSEKVTKDISQRVYNYLKSDGPGGLKIIAKFVEEFEKLSERSPQDDPTNIKNHMPFIIEHIKSTWDSSLTVSESGEISVGIGKDDILGFELDRSKLKHKPSPVVWAVFLIRGIGGRYAFVGNNTYLKKHGRPMPAQYAGGFLISQAAWLREGWDKSVGDFGAYLHPASGASPIPFFNNIVKQVDINEIMNPVLEEMEGAIYEIN